MRDFSRLLRPRNIAVVGGGDWCRSVITSAQGIGFQGNIIPVHPDGKVIAGINSLTSLADHPDEIDAVFVGINRMGTIDAVRHLRELGVGGAVCFASGFTEAKAEDTHAETLQSQLLEAAGDMPILGPNCYGFVNYLDRVALWPDQHGGQPRHSGVAIVTQSSNIAINLTMQKRGLPLAYIVTAGNQAQTTSAEIGAALLTDKRVTALGLHIEGFGDLAAYEALARQAQALGKTVVALKVGKSAQARAATISHTASLAGDEAGAQAFLDRLGFLRAETLPCFLETLKLLHVTGRLPNTRIATISCSGGEASLAADTAEGLALEFPPLNERQKTDLRTALGPMVSLANPLDYHTYIWRDTQAMTRCFAAMMDPSLAMTLLIVDFPRSDRCSAKDWDCAISATIAAKHRTGANVGMVATLPELMPEDVADRLLAEAVVPFHGLTEALIACAAASRQAVDHPPAVLKPKSSGTRPAHQLSEAQAKAALATYGLRLPGFHRVTSADDAAEMAEKLGFPVVLKGEGIAHKTEAGAVRLNLPDSDSVRRAAQGIGTSSFLVEEMVRNSVAELLIGVVCDPAHGFVMTLAAGGILTEVLEDRASFLLPATDEMIEQALSSLRVFRLLAGYRGQPPADHGAILRAVRSVEAYVIGEHFGLQEVEVNPLVCTTSDAIAVDALICRAS